MSTGSSVYALCARGERGSDIDHLLIGPGGVFTINTKRYPDKSVWVGRNVIKIDGRATQYLRISRFEAQRAERLLSTAVGWRVTVRPVLVFLTATVFPDVTIKQQPDDVLVLDRMQIPGAFRRAKNAADSPSRWMSCMGKRAAPPRGKQPRVAGTRSDVPRLSVARASGPRERVHRRRAPCQAYCPRIPREASAFRGRMTNPSGKNPA